MSEEFSNVVSQQYCPECESFDLKRVHRGFIKKKILHSPPQYVCRRCGVSIKENQFTAQSVKKVPALLR